jgi:hypothetical protein
MTRPDYSRHAKQLQRLGAAHDCETDPRVREAINDLIRAELAACGMDTDAAGISVKAEIARRAAARAVAGQ